MATISDKPWDQFTAADYSPEQWRRATLIHMQPADGQDPMTKSLHKVPVREPDGMLNRNGVHAAAGGHGLPAVKGAPQDMMMAAAKELARLYEQIGDPVPPGIKTMAGMASRARAAMDMEMAMFQLGDRVRVVGEPHEPGQTTGTVRLVEPGPLYGIVFDGISEDEMAGQVHKWYAGSELAPLSAGRARGPQLFDRSFPLEGIEILSRAKGGDGRTVEAYAAVFDTPQEIHDQHGDYIEKIHRTSFNRTLNNGGAARALVLYNHGRNVINGKLDSMAQVPLGSPVDVTADGRGLRTVTRYNKSALADSVLEAIRNDDIRGYSFQGGIYRSDPNGRIPRTRPGQPLPTVVRMELGLSNYGPTPTPYYEGAAILAVRSVTDVLSAIADLTDDDRRELIRALATTRPGVPEPAAATPHRGPGAEDPRFAHSGRLQDIARQRDLAAWAELAYMEMAVHGEAAERADR